MDNTQKIINSFYLQDELNPDVWYLPNEEHMGDPNAQNYKLKPEIREHLLKVANLFIDYLDVDFFIHDVVMVGSLAGYNWSEFSDFDIHIIMDLKEGGDKEELYKELFRLKKTVFNSAHNIIIKGFETELFVEDINDTNASAGVYSLINNSWEKLPEKETFKVDEKRIKKKVNQWMENIDDVIDDAKDEDLESAINMVKNYREKLRKYRTCGLNKEGEFSDENLVFKYLRRNGYINKLEDFKNKIADKKLSLEQENTQ
jgi:hypothetical protein